MTKKVIKLNDDEIEQVSGGVAIMKNVNMLGDGGQQNVLGAGNQSNMLGDGGQQNMLGDGGQQNYQNRTLPTMELGNILSRK